MNIYSNEFLNQSITVIQEQLRRKSDTENINFAMLLELENSGKKRVTLARWMEAVSKGVIDVKEDLVVRTEAGYSLDEVVSALQKDIRRGNYFEASFWARDLVLSGNAWRLWRRLQIIALEDIGMANPMALTVIRNLQAHAQEMGVSTWEGQRAGIAGAFYLATSPKSRFMDELTNFFQYVQDGKIEMKKPEIPDYAIDTHTKAGRQKGLSWPSPDSVRHWYGPATVLKESVRLVEDEERFLNALKMADGYPTEAKEAGNEQASGNLHKSINQRADERKPAPRFKEVLRDAAIRHFPSFRRLWHIGNKGIKAGVERINGLRKKTEI